MVFFKIFTFCISLLITQVAFCQVRFHLIYLEGEMALMPKGERVKIGDEFTLESILQFKGKKAIFLDMEANQLKIMKGNNEIGINSLEKALVPIETKPFKCCICSFKSFLLYPEKPYPVLNPKTILLLDEQAKNKYAKNSDQKLTYWFLKDDLEKLQTFPFSKHYDTLYFHKVLDEIKENANQTFIKHFSVYYINTKDKKREWIADRSIIFVDINHLKVNIFPLINYFKKKYIKFDKEIKETILDVVSSFIYEFYGYPDEQNLQIWLKNNFNLDTKY